MIVLWIAASFARVPVTPPPEKVETVGDGVTLARPGDKAEAGDEPEPNMSSESAMDAWAIALVRQNDRRADLAAADVLLADYAPVIADCAGKAAVAVGTATTVRVAFSTTNGVMSATAAKGATGPLADCVVTTLHKKGSGAAFHPVGGAQEKGGSNGSIDQVWTFTYTGPAARVPTTAIDVERSVAGVRLGSPAADMREGSVLRTVRSVQTWYRVLDDNLRFMGVPANLSFLAHPDHGVVGARIRVDGDSNVFRVKESLKARFGAPKYDSIYQAWYWRGEQVVYVAQAVPDSTQVEYLVLDGPAALASGVAKLLPGDRRAADATTDKRLPKVLVDD